MVGEGNRWELSTHVTHGALQMKGTTELTCVKPSSHGGEQALELAQAWTETAATNWANLLHHT